MSRAQTETHSHGHGAATGDDQGSERGGEQGSERGGEQGAAGRRGLALTLLGLAGCGFQPLHAPGPMANGTELAAELGAVRIGPIFERSGQLLRRYLQQRMEDGRPGTPARYELRTGVTIATDLQGYREDGTISRIRYLATAAFTLVRIGPPEEEVLRGSARRFDAYNIPELQFFAADVSRDAMERRLMEGLAEDITRRVALELRRRGQG